MTKVIKSSFAEVWRRILAKTPRFFRKLQALGLSVSGCGTAIAAIPNVPEKLASHGSQMIWLGLVLAAVSQLTVETKK